MKIDKYLEERLTNDKTADAIESNYRGLMQIEGIERDPMQEQYIKLNRLEKRDTPMKPRVETNLCGENFFCPACGRLFYSSMLNFCDKCGQRLLTLDKLK